MGSECFLLRLEPADGKPMLAFESGQWVMVYLSADGDPAKGRAAFSIASAPAESSSGFELAIKVYGEKSRVLHAAAIGTVLGIHGPFGMFTLKSGTRPMALFAGGIGVAPLRSMIRQITLANDSRNVTLFYSNRTSDDACFAEEFERLAAEHPNVRVVFIATREHVPPSASCVPERVHAECGRLDASMLARYCPDVSETECYMCGPNEFMACVESLLTARGLDPKTIRRERFS